MVSKKYTLADMNNIQRIGVIMFGLMGDVLIRTPVLRAFKEIFPDATITAIVDPIGKQILGYNHFVDEIMVIDRKKEKNKLKQNYKKLQAVLSIRKRNFDLIVNLYNAGSSRMMVRFSGAKYKLGFCLKENIKLYNVKNECAPERLKERQSLYNYMISIIEPLSDRSYSLKPIFDLDTNSLKKMDKYLNGLEYKREKLYLLNLGASKEDKILENEKYFFIVKYIYEQYGYIPLVICNPGQEYLQKCLIENYLLKSEVPFVQLEPLALVDIASLIHLTSFMITPDTGLMHLAMALDNSIFAIFTYTHPLFVDIKRKNFIALYEWFDDDKLYQHQEISVKKIQKRLDQLFKKIEN